MNRAEWMNGICLIWSRGRLISPSLPVGDDKYLNLSSQKRLTGRNLGRNHLVRRSGTTSRRTVVLVFCLRMRMFPFNSSSYHIRGNEMNCQSQIPFVYTGLFTSDIKTNFFTYWKLFQGFFQMVFQLCLDAVFICHFRTHSARNHAFQGSEPFSSHFVRCELVRMGTKYTILNRPSKWAVVHCMSPYTKCLLDDFWPLLQSMARVSRVSKLEEILREELGTTKCKSLGFASGGCINEGQSFDTDQGKIFVKLNEKSEVRTPKDFRDLLRGISVGGFPWNWFCLFW